MTHSTSARAALAALVVSLFSSLFSVDAFADESSATNKESVVVEEPFVVDGEVVVITSSFHSPTLAEQPTSITLVDGDEIEKRNATQLEEVLALAPNVNVSSGASRARYLQIRGIGERSQFQEPITPSVGLMVDSIDYSGIPGVDLLFDLEQIEIFRGPQGTRFGSSAMAGLVNLKTNEASETLEANLKLGAGNFNRQQIAGILSGPVTDTLRARLALSRLTSNGYIHNTHLKRRDTAARDETGGRLTLDWLPRDNLSFDFSGYSALINNGYDAFSFANGRTTISDEPGHDRQQVHVATAKSDWGVSDGYSLRTNILVANAKTDYGYDEDWSYVDYHPNGYSSTDNYKRKHSTAGTEARLESSPDGRILADSTDWVVGLYGRYKNEELRRKYTYNPDDFQSTFSTLNLASFFQLDSQLSQRITTSAGLRLEVRQAHYEDQTGLSYNPRETMLGGRLAASYALPGESSTYIALARGYKPGGVNSDGTLPQERRLFAQEALWNSEAGLHTRLLNDSVNFRLSIFYALRDNAQIKSSFARPNNDGSSEFVEFIGNAASGHNYGLEMESTWKISSRVSTGASLGLLRTAYVNFINQNGIDLSGREQPHAPSYQFFVFAQALLSNSVSARIEFEGKDTFYFSDSHNERSTVAQLLHAQISYQRTNWQGVLWGKNLLDRDTQVRGFGGFGNDPADNYTPKTYFQLGAPRELGVTLSYHY